jgi:deoxyribodipyrimidine photo-lyase
MSTSIIADARIHDHGGNPRDDGRYVLYGMTGSLRAEQNDALELAIQRANAHGVGVVCAVGLDPDANGWSPRQVRFVLEALPSLGRALQRRAVPLVVRWDPPLTVLRSLAADAVEVVLDHRVMPNAGSWASTLADESAAPVTTVETLVVVPLGAATDQHEYAARTYRPKLHEVLDDFLEPLRTTALDVSVDAAPEGLPLDEALLDDRRAHDPELHEPVVQGGTSQAKAHLDRFLDAHLEGYGERSPTPTDPAVSYLAPYLRFGMIAPAEVVRRVRGSGANTDDIEAFVEELVVRRELAFNHVAYAPDPDSLSSLPDWARETLDAHEDDPRVHVYTATELEEGRTHDDAWNAAMQTMRRTGYLHNHLRMYWGKQILLWTNTTAHAYRVMRDLNDRYFLDGGCPPSIANALWCFGLHDRAFGERDVTGKTRPMTRSGLDRKIDVERYVDGAPE